MEVSEKKKSSVNGISYLNLVEQVKELVKKMKELEDRLIFFREVNNRIQALENKACEEKENALERLRVLQAQIDDHWIRIKRLEEESVGCENNVNTLKTRLKQYVTQHPGCLTSDIINDFNNEDIDKVLECLNEMVTQQVLKNRVYLGPYNDKI